MYHSQVEECDIYLGLFGCRYGYEDAEGISPTEREYDLATAECKHKLVFVTRLQGRKKACQAIFEMIGKAVDFVMSCINVHVGTRAYSNTADVTCEIPRETETEAIVNAVVHRDYANNGSVEVRLFKDRLEVWNPGKLPYGVSLDKLSSMHASIPVNPTLAHPDYLAGYIEEMGTGTSDIIESCLNHGLETPEFIQAE